MDLKPEQIEQEWNDDQAKRSSTEMLAKLNQAESSTSTVDVEKSPQIDGNGRANGKECKDADHLCRDDAAEGDAGQEQPFPPLSTKGVVPKLIEANVVKDA